MSQQDVSGKPAEDTGSASASRRRGAELEDAILQAAWDVLVEQGYHGFTFEAVAERARTSRPVLYRRWPQRGELVLATLSRYRQTHPISLPDTGRLRDDALAFLRNLNAGRASDTALIGSQLLAFFRDTGLSFQDWQASLGQGGPTPFETIVARAVTRGELRAMPRSARVINLPLDLLRHDIFMSLRAVPEPAIEEIVDEVWLPLLRASAP